MNSDAATTLAPEGVTDTLNRNRVEAYSAPEPTWLQGAPPPRLGRLREDPHAHDSAGGVALYGPEEEAGPGRSGLAQADGVCGRLRRLSRRPPGCHEGRPRGLGARMGDRRDRLPHRPRREPSGEGCGPHLPSPGHRLPPGAPAGVPGHRGGSPGVREVRGPERRPLDRRDPPSCPQRASAWTCRSG